MQFLKAVWEEFEILQGMYEREFAEDTESSCTLTLDDDRRARNEVTLTVGEIFCNDAFKIVSNFVWQHLDNL